MAAASSSRDAYQLAGRSQGSVSVDASQLSGSSDGTSYMFRIGSFNFGIEQQMLTGKRCRDYMRKAQDIITTCVQDAGLHIMNLCELGGHKQGPSSSRFGWVQECVESQTPIKPVRFARLMKD